jgi:alpha,alpha-trehalase
MRLEIIKRNRSVLAAFGVTLLVAVPAFGAPAGSCENDLIPDVYALNIVSAVRPQRVETREALSSPGVNDSWLMLGRRAVAYPDFKYLSDLEPKPLTEQARREIIQRAKELRRRVFNEAVGRGAGESEAVREAQVSYARFVIENLYREETGLGPYAGDMVGARLHLAPGSGPRDLDFAKLTGAFDYVERTWSDLARVSPPSSAGSLIPAPFPFLVAGGRFKESYYWDTYFGAVGLVETGRWQMAAAQLENFLHMIQVYGIIPNGFRDYYLTRSQPPVIARFAMLIYENAPPEIPREKLKEWLVRRVYPLLKRDYREFWMAKRYDAGTGLNFHSDALNRMRPERHSNDDERALGETFRDVRGEAESGLDHTDASMGASSQVGSVLLNSLLYDYEMNLARMAAIAGEKPNVYYDAASKRRRAMNRYNWDEESGTFRNYHFRLKKRGEIVSADMLSTMYVGLASPGQAARMISFAERVFERAGGLRATTVDSGKQWDGVHGWAPFHMMAITGAQRYGYLNAAKRWATKWVSALAAIHARTGYFYEKIDVESVRAPHEDDSKYPTQTGFLWTNASYVWALKYLGFRFKE